MTTTASSRSFFAKGSQAVNDSVAELKKVSFPTRQETMQATFVVILMVCAVSLFLFVMDQIFGRVILSLVASSS